MYQFKPASERILRMRRRIRDRVLIYDSERMRILTESTMRNEHVIPAIRRPLFFRDLCEQMTILVDDDEIIVGNKGPHLFSSVSYPEWSGTDWVIDAVDKGEWTLRDDGLYHNPESEDIRYCITPEDYEYMKSVQDYWRFRKNGTMVDAWQPECFKELRDLDISNYKPHGQSIFGLPAGHLIAGYNKIITTGYKALYEQAQSWIDEHKNRLFGEDMNKYIFYKAAAITCEGAMTLVRRYGEKCASLAEACTDEKRKAELEKMAEALLWLSENPARNFREAVQGIMMYQVMIQIYDRTPSPSVGRFDQYTWPFLKKDLEDGSITMEEAQEIVDAFFLKLNCFYSGAPILIKDTIGVGNTYQNVTVSGMDADGNDATNPVSYMVFETIGRLKLHDPTVIFRTSSNTPKEIWDCAVATSQLVGGLPLYYNDEIVIPALVKEGYELKDARNYGCIGCQEIVGCGTDYPAPNGLFPPHATIWWGSIMDMAINNGINPVNGVHSSLQTGYLYEMNSIEEVREAVRKMAQHIMDLNVTVQNYAENLSMFLAPESVLSLSIEGCMENGKDCTQGGAKYNSFGGTATGLATVADSLTTIKYMCFDKKLCTTRELYDAVMANWEGHEKLRQKILDLVPHYGNNDPYADMEFKWCCDTYYAICKTMYTSRCSYYKAGLYGSSDHVNQGKQTWGTPDGRKFPEPLADAASPAQGRDKNGPLAVFCSSACYDQTNFLGGIALNMRMHPSVLSNDSGRDKLISATQAYFDNGGMEIQYNVVDSDTLRKAQENPEEYRDLVVRIAGYSAYFVELGRDLQNDIISRNEYKL